MTFLFLSIITKVYGFVCAIVTISSAAGPLSNTVTSVVSPFTSTLLTRMAYPPVCFNPECREIMDYIIKYHVFSFIF